MKSKKINLNPVTDYELGAASGGNPFLWAVGGYVVGKLVDYGAWRISDALENPKPVPSAPSPSSPGGAPTRDRANHSPTTPFRGPKF